MKSFLKQETENNDFSEVTSNSCHNGSIDKNPTDQRNVRENHNRENKKSIKSEKLPKLRYILNQKNKYVFYNVNICMLFVCQHTNVCLVFNVNSFYIKINTNNFIKSLNEKYLKHFFFIKI